MSHWQIWVGVFAYSMVTALFVTIAGYSTNSKNGNVSTFAPFALIVIGSFFEALVLCGCIVAWLPILLPGLNVAAFPSIISNVPMIVQVSVISSVAVFVLSILPVVSMLLKSPLVRNFVQALIIFRLLTPGYINTHIQRNGQELSVYPNLWLVAGFALIGFAISFLFACVAGSFFPQGNEAGSSSKGERPQLEKMTGWGYMLGNGVLTALGSVLPLLMYSQ